ncbi:hypothetical protein Scep_016451 [Stephania cephalantha]|uniref:TCP domain-containing protein n=1 Tax=Stephania cephalantha TaxID=152367 RepID=A0AAP0NT89_9MAGN
MINYSIERDVPAKQEGDANSTDAKTTKASSSTSRSWSGLKDPRVVRVSRAFGGKDRHSKVCTIRGLRDRRVRLSVPTAIQLYDLQDRLGLNQPSKVVDWLLNAAKHEIDELPPLQMPPSGIFGQFPQSMLLSHHHQSSLPSSLVGRNLSSEKQHHQGLQSLSSPSNKQGGLNTNNDSIDLFKDQNQATAPSAKSTYWNLNAPSGSNGGKDNIVAQERQSAERSTHWMKRISDEDNQEAVDNNAHHHQVSSSHMNNIHNHNLSKASPISLMDNNVNVPNYNSYYHWDLSLSHLGNHGQNSSIQNDHHHQDSQNYNVVQMPSSFSLPSSASQLLLCPSVASPASFFSPYLANHHSDQANSKQIMNHFPMMMNSQNILAANPVAPAAVYSLNNQPVRPFQLNINAKHHYNAQSNDDHASHE